MQLADKLATAYLWMLLLLGITLAGSLLVARRLPKPIPESWRLRMAVVAIAYGSVILLVIAAVLISGTPISELTLLSGVAGACSPIGLGVVILLDIRRKRRP